MPAGTSAIFYSDSQYLINCFDGIWKRNKNTDLFSALDRVSKGKKISMSWVRGHSGNAMNERCDELASSAMFNENLAIDKGYQEQNATASKFYLSVEEYQKGGKISAMSVTIQIPEDLNGQTEYLSHHAYCEKYHVQNVCAAAIEKFSMSKTRSFKAYAALKTGGIDYWSYKKIPSLMEGLENAEAVVDEIRKYLPDEKDAAVALRWHRRGLLLSDSIRKAFVDKEIAQNIARST